MLLGITGASAQCSYIGVAAGDSYDYSFKESGTFSGLQETLSGTMHVHIDNVTNTTYVVSTCEIGVTVTPSGIMQEISEYSEPFDVHNGTFIIYDSSRLLNTDFIISKNVLNKTFNYKDYNNGLFGNSDGSVTWDSNGVLNSAKWNLREGYGDLSSYCQMDLERVGGSTPGPEPFMFAILFVAGIAIIILKKRGMFR